MRLIALGLFVCGMLAVSSFSTAQPPGQPGKDKDKGGKDKGDKGGKGGPGGGGKTLSVEELVAQMMAYDANKDGKLTKEELTDTRLHRLFARADAKKSGFVTKEDFATLFTAELAAGGGGKGGPGGKDGKDGTGGKGGFRPPAPGTILPVFLQDFLTFTDAQKKQLAEMQKDVDAKLDKLLTDDQKKQLKEFLERGPGGPGGFPGGPSPKDGAGETVPMPRVKPRDVPVTLENIKKSVEKSMPILWKAVNGHSESRSCFTCHNHGVPLLAFATARDHGFTVPEAKVKELVAFITEDMERNRERFARGQGPGGEVDNASYSMFALDVVGYKADKTTEIVAQYILGKDKNRDHWGLQPPRPPSEHSPFTPTALALRAVQKFAVSEQQESVAKRTEVIRGWLLKTPAKDTEDRVFRLLGLKAAGAKDEDIRAATKELAATQREDGGWGQLDTMNSDAYATGTALYALHTAGGTPTDDPAYKRGLAFLLGTQADDGSWHVRTRTRVIVQKYFESGFPYEKDQFISCAATGWATTALALACPTKK